MERQQLTMRLADVAVGRVPAEMVIVNGTLVNVLTRELLPGWGVAIAAGHIAAIGDVGHCVGADTQVIDAAGMFLVPGFIDGHLHVESSMLTVTEYARAVIPHGTSAILMDPHEMANVCGLEGVGWMLDEAKNLPLRVYATLPSCVPACPGFEEAGGTIPPLTVAAHITADEWAGLGEMMNFPAVVNADADAHAMLAATLAAGKPITGHYSVPCLDAGLDAYIAAGARCCHESTTAADALAKMRRGMYAQVREGSAWLDIKETIKCVTQTDIDSRLCTLVSDDCHADTLLELGHMDHIVRRAIQEGVKPVTALQMATINAAQALGWDAQLGSIAPGKAADINLLSSLEDVKVAAVVLRGQLAAREGKLLIDLPAPVYPPQATATMHLAAPVMSTDLALPAPSDAPVTVRVIRAQAGQVATVSERAVLVPREGLLWADPAQDLCKVAVFDRHHASGTVGLGFVRGFRLRKGALASTVAHDAHQLLCVGTDDADMALACRALEECGGGMAVACDGKVLAVVRLPIAGLFSPEPATAVAAQVAALDAAIASLGCDMPSPFMTMALLSLCVLPEIHLTHLGLVENFARVDLMINEKG